MINLIFAILLSAVGDVSYASSAHPDLEATAIEALVEANRLSKQCLELQRELHGGTSKELKTCNARFTALTDDASEAILSLGKSGRLSKQGKTRSTQLLKSNLQLAEQMESLARKRLLELRMQQKKE